MNVFFSDVLKYALDYRSIAYTEHPMDFIARPCNDFCRVTAR